jgi:hypothetical protein
VSGNQISGGEKVKSVGLELVDFKPLEHPALLQYLTKWGIDHDIARQHLSQIDFKAPQGTWSYFALGHSAGEGFEARKALFKGFIGIGKAVTFHDKPEATRLQVFEGFMDFLSYLSKDKPSQPVGAVLVLNSTNLWRRACPTSTIRVLQRCACTWTTTTLAVLPAANCSSTRKMPQNLSICAATTQAMRISTPGSSGANRKLRLFHTFFYFQK